MDAKAVKGDDEVTEEMQAELDAIIDSMEIINLEVIEKLADLCREKTVGVTVSRCEGIGSCRVFHRVVIEPYKYAESE